MELGELLGVLILVGFYVLSTLAGNKKKRQRPRARPVPPSPPRPVEYPVESLPEPREVSTESRSGSREVTTVPNERDPVRDPRGLRAEAPVPRPVAAVDQRRQELLDQAERYLGQVASQQVATSDISKKRPPDGRAARRLVAGIDAKDARQGVIWQAVLGTPKGLE